MEDMWGGGGGHFGKEGLCKMYQGITSGSRNVWSLLGVPPISPEGDNILQPKHSYETAKTPEAPTQLPRISNSVHKP